MGHSNHNHGSESSKNIPSNKGFQTSNLKSSNGDVWADAPAKNVWHPNWQPNWTQPSWSFTPNQETSTSKTTSQNVWSNPWSNAWSNAWGNDPTNAQPLWAQAAQQVNPWNVNGSFSEGTTRTAWFSPPTCIAESTNSFLVCCELPGVNERDLNIIWNDGTLIIRGQKREFQFENGFEIYATDQLWGHFHREISMSHVAACIDSSKITTKFSDGVLQITFPKMTEGNKSFIKVSSKK